MKCYELVRWIKPEEFNVDTDMSDFDILIDGEEITEIEFDVKNKQVKLWR